MNISCCSKRSQCTSEAMNSNERNLMSTKVFGIGCVGLYGKLITDNKETMMNLEEKRAKYLKLCHAMQTGVAFKMEKDNKDTTPKHLRVGINAAMVDHAALTNLL